MARDSRGANERRRTRLRTENRKNVIRRPNAGQSNRLRISLGLGPIGPPGFPPYRRRGVKSDDTIQGPTGETPVASAAQSAPPSGRPFTQDIWSTFVANAKNLLKRLLLL